MFSFFFLQGRSDKSVGFSHLQQRSSKDIASCCVQLLPALCSHMENCHNHFQVQTRVEIQEMCWENWRHQLFIWMNSSECKYALIHIFLVLPLDANLANLWTMSDLVYFFHLSIKIALRLYTFAHFCPDTDVWKQWRCGRTCHRYSGAPADVIRLPAAPASPEHHLQLVRRTSTTDFHVRH